MNQFSNNPLSNIPPVVKNLLILNVLAFLAVNFLFPDYLNGLALHFFKTPDFQPFQVVTHMFMHGGFPHLFLNMFALWMFGSALEKVWGPKRFLTFYLLAGLGAALFTMGVDYGQFSYYIHNFTPEQLTEVYNSTVFNGQVKWYSLDGNNPAMVKKAVMFFHKPAMVGASGALFGVLMAFAMIYPNTELMLIFLPVPFKAKHFVPGVLVISIIFAICNFSWDPIAHWGHIGGAVVGFIIMKIWIRNRTTFY